MSRDIVLATINAKWIHPSLALRLLKANLGSLKDQCEIVEFALRQPLAEKISALLASRPRILALSVSIWNHLASLELLKELDAAWRKEEPSPGQRPFVVLGGPEVSWLPEQAEIFRYADYVIRGEGEESFRELCFELLAGRTAPEGEGASRGAIFINQGDTGVDLKKLAPAYYLYTDEDLQKKLIYVEASRSCPFSCVYCQGGLRQPRVFPLEPFLTQMEKLISRKARTFKFLDRCFNMNMARAIRIMEFFLKQISSLPGGTASQPPLCVHFEMLPSRFPPALREVLRRFPPGTLRLEIGIQTLNSETSALIKRPAGFLEELELLAFLRRETNALLHVDLIAGLPGEDLGSFGAGFDRLWQTLVGSGNFEIQVGILKCLPGTPISRYNKAQGLHYSSEPPYEVIETGAIPAAELERIKNFARFWERIVNRNQFPNLLPRLLPPRQKVFDRFMDLSDRLLEEFGRNWGIDRKELENFLEKGNV